MTIETVTPEFLERTFNSPEFNLGLARIIEITEQTGYEALFGIAKKVGEEKLIYTPEIVIGNQTSVNRTIAFDRAKTAYQMVTGQKPQINTFSGLKSFRTFCKNFKQDTETPFPHLEASQSWEEELEIGNINDFYALFSLHTHPNGHCRPSEGDLGNLNYLRTNSYQGIETIFPRTIDIIAGTLSPETGKKYKKFIPISFTQERTKEPLSDRQIKKGYSKLAVKYEGFQKERMLRALFGRSVEPIGNKPGDIYNFALAFFDRDAGKIDFSKDVPTFPMNFRDFAFKC